MNKPAHILIGKTVKHLQAANRKPDYQSLVAATASFREQHMKYLPTGSETDH